jgi:hypothetical protein
MKTLTFFSLMAFLSIVPAGAQRSAWEPMNRGLQHLLVYTIEIDPVDSLVMYAGTDYGNLYKSTDGGFNSFLSRDGIPTNYNREAITALYLDRDNRRQIFAGFGGRQASQNLFRSDDAGLTWSVMPTPSEWSSKGVLVFFKSFGSNSRIFCGTGWGGGVWYSTNAGVAWKQTLQDRGVQVISGHPALPLRVFAGTSAHGAMYRSLDGGLNWSLDTAGFYGANVGTGVRAITVAAQDSNLVYAGVTGQGAGLYVSRDGGGRWNRLNTTDEISEIAVHPNNRNLIYISAIHTGVRRSTDGGNTWTTINEGLPTTDVMRVRIAPGYPVRVFAMTLKHGIYRMVDEELDETMIRYAGDAALEH